MGSLPDERLKQAAEELADDVVSRYMLERRVKELEATIERQRQALETICEIGETRDVQVASAALSEGGSK